MHSQETVYTTVPSRCISFRRLAVKPFFNYTFDGTKQNQDLKTLNKPCPGTSKQISHACVPGLTPAQDVEIAGSDHPWQVGNTSRQRTWLTERQLTIGYSAPGCLWEEWGESSTGGWGGLAFNKKGHFVTGCPSGKPCTSTNTMQDDKIQVRYDTISS